MRYTAKTEYGVVCLVYIARHGTLHPVSIKEIVKDEKFSWPFTEKILQKLRAKNIVSSQQGSHGGYVLSRPASEITMKEVVEALEGVTFDVFCEPKVRKDIICTHFPSCEIMPLWKNTKQLLDAYYESITLEKLAKSEVKSPAQIKI